jgi:large subunit ribosomal protein L25
METITLRIERREADGARGARALRRAGQIPAIYYGRGEATQRVRTSAREFVRKLGRLRGTHLIRCESTAADLNGKTVILKEVQVHPSTSEVLHVDFYAIDLTRRLRVQVPLQFEGKPVGVTAGGVLQPIQREIAVECLPDAIPESVRVDVSNLGIHEAVHIEEVVLPEGVRAIFDSNFAIVTVLPPTVEAAPEAAAAPTEVPAEGEAAAGAPATAAPEAAAGDKRKEGDRRKEKE